MYNHQKPKHYELGQHSVSLDGTARKVGESGGGNEHSGGYGRTQLTTDQRISLVKSTSIRLTTCISTQLRPHLLYDCIVQFWSGPRLGSPGLRPHLLYYCIALFGVASSVFRRTPFWLRAHLLYLYRGQLPVLFHISASLSCTYFSVTIVTGERLIFINQ